jgi:hypothetical protein
MSAGLDSREAFRKERRRWKMQESVPDFSTNLKVPGKFYFHISFIFLPPFLARETSEA